MARVQLKDITFARSGDKGNISTIGLMALNSDYYQQLKRELVPIKIKQHFNGMVKGDVEVFPMDNIESFQVLLHDGLDGGATRSLRLDQTGKAMCTALQRMWVNID